MPKTMDQIKAEAVQRAGAQGFPPEDWGSYASLQDLMEFALDLDRRLNALERFSLAPQGKEPIL